MTAGSHLCRRKRAGTGPADTSLTSLASCWCSVASAALTAGSQAGGPWASAPLGAAPAAGCAGSSAPLGAADSAGPAGPWLACCACCERGLPMPGDAGVPEAARLCPLGDGWPPCARPRSAAAAVPPPAAPLHSCVLMAVSPNVQHLRPRHAARPHSGITGAGAGAALLRRTGAQPLGSHARPRAAWCCTARCLHSLHTISPLPWQHNASQHHGPVQARLQSRLARRLQFARTCSVGGACSVPTCRSCCKASAWRLPRAGGVAALGTCSACSMPGCASCRQASAWRLPRVGGTAASGPSSDALGRTSDRWLLVSSWLSGVAARRFSRVGGKSTQDSA